MGYYINMTEGGIGDIVLKLDYSPRNKRFKYRRYEITDKRQDLCKVVYWLVEIDNSQTLKHIVDLRQDDPEWLYTKYSITKKSAHKKFEINCKREANRRKKIVKASKKFYRRSL